MNCAHEVAVPMNGFTGPVRCAACGSTWPSFPVWLAEGAPYYATPGRPIPSREPEPAINEVNRFIDSLKGVAR